MGLSKLLFWRRKRAGGAVPPEVRCTPTVDDGWQIVNEFGDVVTAEEYVSQHRLETSIDDYEQLGLLGKGAMASVRLVRNKRNGKLYAMKEVTKRTVMQSSKPSNIMRERNVMRRAASPHVVQLHQCIQTDTSLFYIMEYMAGGDMYKYTEQFPRGKLDEDTAKYYAAQIFLALRDLHSRSIIYRDLKPENVLLTREGNAKLADFGLSKELLFGDDRTASFVGTAMYIAPEILRGKRYTYEVDWWSYGVFVYNLLTGLNPFGGRTVDEVFKAILRSTARIDGHKISDDAKSFLSGLLTHDPAKRLRGESIRDHPWFSTIDWEALESGSSLPPMWQPLAGSINEGAPGSPISPTAASKPANGLTQEQQRLFEGFDFESFDFLPSSQASCCSSGLSTPRSSVDL